MFLLPCNLPLTTVWFISGFSAKNAVGHDVVKLLQDAFNRKHLHVKCVALVNDVGVYMRHEIRV